ncbi:MAG: hypothetical protein MUP71_10135 [Candidatus Aminicenantes bacterium]|nr:hypothetical protein [Candidatus Aminicenantes bacterium]
MKKNTLIIVTIVSMLLLANVQLAAYQLPAKKSFLKKQFCLRGGLNRFTANGVESDYVAGANDFPVTPAFQSPVLGFGFAFFTSRSFAIGLDVRYGLSAAVDLRDPSDGETIAVDTPKNLTAVFNLYKYFDFSKRLGLYVSLGGGLENLMAEEKEYLSNLGNKIIIAGPDQALSPLAAGALGLQAMLSRSLGLAFDFQAAYVFRKKNQLQLSPSLALVLKF